MATWYVSKSGTDSAATPGTLSSPWKTIGYAMTESRVKNGDTVSVRTGVYYEKVSITKEITVQNYSSESVTVTGRADEEYTNSGLPSSLSQTSSVIQPGNSVPLKASWDGLVAILVDNVTWNGIDVINGLGAGVKVGNDTTNIDGVTISNCYIANHRKTTIQISGGKNTGVYITDLTIDHVRSAFAGMLNPSDNRGSPMDNWPGLIALRGCNGATISNCDFWYSWGDILIVDANSGHSKNIIIEDCTFGDLWGPSCVYIHAAHNVTIQRNICYSTKTGRAYSICNSYGGSAINIAGAESAIVGGAGPAGHIKVVNNIVVKCSVGIHASKQLEYVADVLFANNTIINCAIGANMNVKYVTAPANIKNNIFTNCPTKATNNLSNWTWDYNCWDALPAAAAR